MTRLADGEYKDQDLMECPLPAGRIVLVSILAFINVGLNLARVQAGRRNELLPGM